MGSCQTGMLLIQWFIGAFIAHCALAKPPWRAARTVCRQLEKNTCMQLQCTLPADCPVTPETRFTLPPLLRQKLDLLWRAAVSVYSTASSRRAARHRRAARRRHRAARRRRRRAARRHRYAARRRTTRRRRSIRRSRRTSAARSATRARRVRRAPCAMRVRARAPSELVSSRRRAAPAAASRVPLTTDIARGRSFCDASAARSPRGACVARVSSSGFE